VGADGRGAGAARVLALLARAAAAGEDRDLLRLVVHAPIVQHALGEIDAVEFERAMRRIREFERMLTAEHFPVLKYHLHISKKVEKKRLKEFWNDPAKRWRVHENSKKYFKRYDDFRRVTEEMLRLSNSGFAPGRSWRARTTSIATSRLPPRCCRRSRRPPARPRRGRGEAPEAAAPLPKPSGATCCGSSR